MNGSALSDIFEHLISDKIRIASILNDFKNDPFCTCLVSLLMKVFLMLYKPRKSRQKFCGSLRVFYQI